MWPLNPKATDHKIRPSKVYTTTLANTSNESSEGSDDTTNEQEQWGENADITQLINIAATLQELETPKANEHEQLNVMYYMEEPKNVIAANVNGKIEMIYDLIVDANGPIVEMQQVHHHVVAA
jgi:hypothetical protein